MSHAKSVHLVSLMKTGLVSPQLHVQFDNYLMQTRLENYMPKSDWQVKAKLIKPPANLDPCTIT